MTKKFKLQKRNFTAQPGTAPAPVSLTPATEESWLEKHWKTLLGIFILLLLLLLLLLQFGGIFKDGLLVTHKFANPLKVEATVDGAMKQELSGEVGLSAEKEIPIKITGGLNNSSTSSTSNTTNKSTTTSVTTPTKPAKPATPVNPTTPVVVAPTTITLTITPPNTVAGPGPIPNDGSSGTAPGPIQNDGTSGTAPEPIQNDGTSGTAPGPIQNDGTSGTAPGPIPNDSSTSGPGPGPIENDGTSSTGPAIPVNN